VAGQLYVFDITSSDFNATFSDLDIFDANGTIVQGSSTNQLVFTAGTSGTFYAQHDPTTGVTGDYSISARLIANDLPEDISTTGTVIVDGGPTASTVDFSNDNDWFAVTLQAGSRYLF